MNNQEFLENRKVGIGGSDVSAILGKSKFKTAVDVWEEKLGKVQYEKMSPCHPQTASRYWGRELEEPIIAAYEDEKRIDVVRGSDLGQIVHPEYPWLIANVDGIGETQERGKILIEAKNWDYDPNEEWGEEETDQIPPDYIYQTQHYLNVTGLKEADIAARIKGVLKFFHVPRNQALINGIHQKLKNFWFINVQKKIAPPPQNLSDMRKTFPYAQRIKKEATENVVNAVTTARKLQVEIKEREKQLKSHKLIIADCMGACDELVAGNERMATFKENKNGTRVFKIS